jgi:type IV pilus assembly protein PilV
MISAKQRTRGFSIVEALVALVVLSIGMLGIAALYVESLQSGRSAIYRTQAVNLANDLADRIRANRTAGSAYSLPANGAPVTGTCAPTNTQPSANCTPPELATDDLARWLASIRAQLPPRPAPGQQPAPGSLPRGMVVVTPAACTSSCQYSIQISWSEPRAPLVQGVPTLTYILNLQI